MSCRSCLACKTSLQYKQIRSFLRLPASTQPSAAILHPSQRWQGLWHKELMIRPYPKPLMISGLYYRGCWKTHVCEADCQAEWELRTGNLSLWPLESYTSHNSYISPVVGPQSLPKAAYNRELNTIMCWHYFSINTTINEWQAQCCVSVFQLESSTVVL